MRAGFKPRRVAVAFPFARTAARKTAFGRDHDAVAIRIKRLSDLLFVNMRSIRIRRVDKVDAQIDRAPQHRQSILAVVGPAPDARSAQPHPAKTQPMDG